MTPSAADDWGYRSTVQAKGAADRDCPPRGGDGGGAGGGQGGGGGHGRGCSCGCSCGCGGHQAGDVRGCGCTCRDHGHRDHGHQNCDCGQNCGCGDHDGSHGHPGHHGHQDDHHDHQDHHGDGCGCGHHHGRDQGEAGGSRRTGTTIGWKNPNRPRRQYGWTTGQVPGGQLDPCDFSTPPWNEWPGDRGDLYLPFLFLRANAGDLGARPVVGPFWESPDILLLAGEDPATAPPVPPELGQTALAGKPNTLYAHVWNFGLSAAPNVVVEFYWCDPTLGIGPAGAHLVGVTVVSLGARGSGRSHAVVKCPTAWFPTFVNGGHECLVVRVWDETSDGLGTPPWDAALNRHVAQRNIHVAAVGEAMRARGGDAFGPLLLPAPLNAADPEGRSAVRRARPGQRLARGAARDALAAAAHRHPRALPGASPTDGGSSARRSDAGGRRYGRRRHGGTARRHGRRPAGHADDDGRRARPRRGPCVPRDGESAGRDLRRVHGGPARLAGSGTGIRPGGRDAVEAPRLALPLVSHVPFRRLDRGGSVPTQTVALMQSCIRATSDLALVPWCPTASGGSTGRSCPGARPHRSASGPGALALMLDCIRATVPNYSPSAHADMQGKTRAATQRWALSTETRRSRAP